MKVMLINIENEWGGVPLGLVYIAGYLRKEVKDVVIKIINKNYISEIKKFSPDIIGISAMSNEFFSAKKLAEKIKEEGINSALVLGGVHITMMPKDLLETVFDIGVVGEGEKTFSELVKQIKQDKGLKIEKIKEIKGLAINENKKLFLTNPREQIKDLDEIPFPAFDLLNIKEMLLPGPATTRLMGIRGYLMTSRGCPYNCTFCGSKAYWKTVRWHSEKRVVDEIEFWIKKYDVDHFIIQDDLFSFSKERVRKIVNLMEKRNLLGKSTFDVLARANLFDEELAALFKKLNVVSVGFGFETGSDRMLKFLKGENVTVKQNVEAIKICNKYGFKIHGFIMIGSPYEEEEDIMKTLDFIKNNKIDSSWVFQAVPYPGTEFWRIAVKDKIVEENFYTTGKNLSMTALNPEYLLTDKISKERFIELFKLVKNEAEKLNSRYKYKLNIKPKYILKMFSWEFIKKMSNKRKSEIYRYLTSGLKSVLRIK